MPSGRAPLFFARPKKSGEKSPPKDGSASGGKGRRGACPPHGYATRSVSRSEASAGGQTHPTPSDGVGFKHAPRKKEL